MIQMEKRRFSKAFFLLYVINCVLVTSCTPVFYAPGTVPVPGLEEKGDIRAAVHTAESSDSESGNSGTGIDIELAYSPIDGIGLIYHSNNFSDRFSNSIVNGHTFLGIPTFRYERFTAKGSLHNLGAGKYHHINDKLIWETYATVGLGKFSITPDRTGSKLTAGLNKIAIQSGLLFKTPFFEAGFTFGLASLNYKNIQGDVIHNDQSQNAYLKNHNSHILANHASTIRLGAEQLKVQLQIGGVSNLTHRDFLMNDNFVSLGIVANPNLFFNKNN